MKTFGLIGYPLTHSFSKRYFTEKFEREGIAGCRYELFELPDIQDFPALFVQHPDLAGLNVTIPHKLAVMPFLQALDASAEKVGAVNVIKIEPDGRLVGYNSDYYGFKQSLQDWLGTRLQQPLQALLLGDGGATKAVKAALTDLDITYQTVSRQAAEGKLTYTDLNEEIISSHQLIINCSPLGTYPNINTCPDIPYQYLTPQHFLYDLVYNPAETLFMTKGLAQGATVINGLPMLQLQAEKAWEVWN
ncbi:MAG: shikimate dehydrogenase [Spirosomataceae bacterium]